MKGEGGRSAAARHLSPTGSQPSPPALSPSLPPRRTALFGGRQPRRGAEPRCGHGFPANLGARGAAGPAALPATVPAPFGSARPGRAPPPLCRQRARRPPGRQPVFVTRGVFKCPAVNHKALPTPPPAPRPARRRRGSPHNGGGSSEPPPSPQPGRAA